MKDAPIYPGMYLDYEYLSSVGRNIRLHGNRFIQIDVSEVERVHLWSDLIPIAQRIPTWIHNHVFGFESIVLAGTLLNVGYVVSPWYERKAEAWHHAYEGRPRQGSDTELVRADDLMWQAIEHLAIIVPAGDSYRMNPLEYHASSYVGHAVTLMTKTATLPGKPRVLCPRWLQPDNEYDRYKYSSSDLWAIVREILALSQRW